jgi:hypothetical protein
MVGRCLYTHLRSATSETIMRFSGLFLLAIGAFGATSPAPQISVPIRFEPNRGQMSTTSKDPVLWMARGLDYAFLFSPESSVLRVGSHAFRMRFRNANPAAPFEGQGRMNGTTQYLTADFQASLPNYPKLRRNGIYPGIDVVYYGNASQLEYDFEAAPGADPSLIRFRFEGLDSVRMSDTGDLLLALGTETIVQRAPVVYQVAPDGKRITVKASYRASKEGWISFALGKYDPTLSLVIDPEIVYSKYLFGTKLDTAIAVAHDNNGFLYIAGNTLSSDFSIQGASYAEVNTGGQDIWLMKINTKAEPDGQVIYGSYFGGGGSETLKAMAVDPETGYVYLTGVTTSTNLPTKNAYRTVNNTNDVFVVVLDPSVHGPDGLIYSTYFGSTATDDVRAIATRNGKAYITGHTSTSDFPVVNAFQSTLLAGADIFVSVFDPSASGTASLAISTFINAAANDYARTIAVDEAGKVYIAGVTYSPDLPKTPDAYETEYFGGGEIFLLKMDLEEKQVLYGTYFGGSNLEEAKKILIEPSGRIVMTGFTMSPDLPITQNAYQPFLNGTSNAFLAVFDLSKPNRDGLVYSTYFGAEKAEVAYDVARDIEGKYYFVGYTLSRNLPVTNDAWNMVTANGGTDAFFAVIDPSAPAINSLIYSTYITSKGTQIAYGVDVDLNNTAYVVGTATSGIFPPGQAAREMKPGNTDGFLAALQFPPPPQELIDQILEARKEALEAKQAAGDSQESTSQTVDGSSTEMQARDPGATDPQTTSDGNEASASGDTVPHE